VKLARIIAAVLLLVLAGAAVANESTGWLAALVMVGMVSHAFASQRVTRSVRLLWPVLLFAAVLVLMQWIGGTLTPELPLRTVSVFLLVNSAVLLLPWTEMLERARPGSPLYTGVLFLLFVRHFVAIFGEEVRRLLIARSLAVPRRYGPGWFESLKWAMAELFRRSLARAERFHAAQALRGLGE
jgi:hypothetical protein